MVMATAPSRIQQLSAPARLIHHPQPHQHPNRAIPLTRAPQVTLLGRVIPLTRAPQATFRVIPYTRAPQATLPERVIPLHRAPQATSHLTRLIRILQVEARRSLTRLIRILREEARLNLTPRTPRTRILREETRLNLTRRIRTLQEETRRNPTSQEPGRPRRQRRLTQPTSLLHTPQSPRLRQLPPPPTHSCLAPRL
jgi:hypothetical protein